MGPCLLYVLLWIGNNPSHCKLIPYPCDTKYIQIPPDKTLGILVVDLCRSAAYRFAVAGRVQLGSWATHVLHMARGELGLHLVEKWWGWYVIHCMLWATKANQVWSSIRQRVRWKMADRLRIDTQSFQWFPDSGNLDPTTYIDIYYRYTILDRSRYTIDIL
jgi:hypothetical protein